MSGEDTLGADHKKVTSLSPAEAWKFSGAPNTSVAYKIGENSCLYIIYHKMEKTAVLLQQNILQNTDNNYYE